METVPMDPAGLMQGCPWSLCLRPLPVGSGLSSASSFPPAQKRQLRYHGVPSPCHQEVTSSKPLRCCQPRRPRGGFQVGFAGGVSLHHPGAPRAGPSLPVLLSPASLIPASQPQHCRVGRPDRGCGEVMPRSKLSAPAGRAGSFLRARCQPSTPNPGGKKKPTLRVDISTPCASPAGGFASPGAPGVPAVPFPLPMVALWSPPWQLRSGASAALSSHARMG